MSELKIIDIKNTINDWAGNQITIRKEENEDLDQINIQLEKATFEQRDSVDDYIADNVMFLHGTAYSTEDGEKQSFLLFCTKCRWMALRKSIQIKAS
ncbi:hypothetical protein QUF79_06480 [Fictibacillus enclensis]|uniref:hypothetical protein n=1 Tax=Fictibacillus enclensis TaxID=1017270 RepID=UPI00259FEDE9|nr:hypothetical protein [Fictibacillus enclensis]MDM5197661.1 hypothetical protein [Fictibacillus enclensis]